MIARNIKHILLTLLLVAGCATVPDAEVDSAENYLFPNFKTTSEPQYIMTAAERRKAVREWHRENNTAWNAGILYEVIVDEKGSVVKIRAAEPYPRDDNEQYYTKAFQRVVQSYQFKADAAPNAYRTFYYPLLVKWQSGVLNEP